MSQHLSNHHRKTVEELFAHPTSHNVEWRKVLSLLGAVGTVTEEHDGKYKVTVGPETEIFHRPHDKDVPVAMVVDLRRMLTPILGLSVGLVLFTALGVAVVAHWLLPISFAVAFALGAIVAPPDAVAATSVARPCPHHGLSSR